ncbi:hypothetical protein K523DRAFT_320382 [Schizophyllum commune Tattone D]|nr:hypothetical protein K525DRAFT_278627 [Schizophyllum commune Loenen D]KAI5829774.1 hypothetical protein K523DRAFT_320382 [Schizophyllum commune Tattone D]
MSQPVDSAKQPAKQIAFATGTRMRAGVSGTRKSNKHDPTRSRRHLVYAIKLSEEGFRGWSASHLQPPPPGLEGKALQERWEACKGMMASLIPWRCSDDFDLPVVNGEYVTRVRDGDKSVLVVPLADNRASLRRHRHPPSDEVVAQVAEAIFQPGAVPDWYQVVP